VELLDGVFGTVAVVTATDDRALLDALCETETALARACTRAGLIDLATALEIGVGCDDVRSSMEPGDLGRRAAAGGNPVIPLVEELRRRVAERAGPDAAAAVHLGATSQDIMDTALMLVASRAIGVILGDLGDCANAAAALARSHLDTPMAARTLLQQAVPTTFGALAAVWGSALDRARAGLNSVRETLPVSLGGAAGTLSALHPHGFEVLDAFADELELAAQRGVWHGDRTVVHDLAGALGSAAAAASKVAGDIVLLAQGELGEVREAAPGGSSAMAHKQNPIAAITARAAAVQAPGLVATLLACVPELQRGAGTWHAEWPALLSLLRWTGGSAARLRISLLSLEIDHDAMARNLALLPDTVDTTDLGSAGELVEKYLDGRTA
jgi:3-carboxy-cis,cis-muconate cycloisomerase